MTATDPAPTRGVPRRLYGGYGLVIASDLLLPELPAVTTATPAPDVVIRHGALPEFGQGQEPAATRIFLIFGLIACIAGLRLVAA